VNSVTKLKIPDTDGSGTVTLADLKAGGKVDARPSTTEATLAVSISAKGDYQRGDEVEGAVSAVGAASLTVTKEDGTSATVNVNTETKLRAPDRDGSGTVTLADVLVSDKVEIYLSATDPTLALSVKVEAKGTKIAGTVAAVGADSVTITLADATTKTVTVNSSTKLRIPAADGTPTGTLADLKVGDAVKAKTVSGADGTTLALCLSAGALASANERGQRGPRGNAGPNARGNVNAQDGDRRGGRGRGR